MISFENSRDKYRRNIRVNRMIIIHMRVCGCRKIQGIPILIVNSVKPMLNIAKIGLPCVISVMRGVGNLVDIRVYSRYSRDNISRVWYKCKK
jgi:hypothetical protein